MLAHIWKVGRLQWWCDQGSPVSLLSSASHGFLGGYEVATRGIQADRFLILVQKMRDGTFQGKLSTMRRMLAPKP